MTVQEINSKKDLIRVKCHEVIGGFKNWPNNKETWKSVENACDSLLCSLWRKGDLIALAQNDAYSIECGLASTMTAEDVLQGILRVMIKLRLSALPEFAVLNIELQLEL